MRLPLTILLVLFTTAAHADPYEYLPSCTVATIGACGGAVAGKNTTILITDSGTTNRGATIAGGGANTVAAWCEGTTCRVMGSPAAVGSTIYGEMTQNADPGACNAVTIGAQDAFVDVDGFSAGQMNGFTFASDALTVGAGNGGDYHVTGIVSFEGAANSVYEFCASIDGTEDVNCCFNRKTSNADVGAGALSCILTLAAGEAVSLEVADHDATPQNLSVCDSTVTVTAL